MTRRFLMMHPALIATGVCASGNMGARLASRGMAYNVVTAATSMVSRAQNSMAPLDALDIPVLGDIVSAMPLFNIFRRSSDR